MDADEQVDVLDDFGEPTGQVLSKHEVHRRELWHSGAHIWIYNRRGEVLMQQRSVQKEIHPGTWDISAAGHRKAGDTAVSGALREVKEELGIRLESDQLKFVGITRYNHVIPNRGYTHRVFDWTFIVCRELDPVKLKLQAEEVQGASWWPLDRLESEAGKAKNQLSPRPRYFFDLAIFEIRAALARK